MSFYENLINLRKKENWSQEQLAEKLDVSRQAVSKWESGNGYPEMEKLLMICEIFDCSLDTLMKGKILEDTTGIKSKYDSFHNMFSKATAIAVDMVLAGVVLFLIITSREQTTGNFDLETIGIIVLLTFVTLAVPVFVYLGMKHEEFRKKYSKMPYIYSEKEIDAFDRKYPITVTAGVTVILIGVILFFVFSGRDITNTNPSMPIIILLIFVMIAVPIFIYFGSQKEKYDIDSYNHHNPYNLEDYKKENSMVGKLCGVVMLIAVAFFLGSGFIYHAWNISWVVFPIAGVLCGIVSILFSED